MTKGAADTGFKIHAAVFLAAVIINVGINLLTGPPWWSVWVFFPWVVGVAIHWYFSRSPKLS